ncbi:MAG: hypothetical protein COC04_04535 [Gammaproteobacteria bacterium]|nr:MAG: hypothetical protein COC04_04535 [Gammaproteobacteria bacterium]
MLRIFFYTILLVMCGCTTSMWKAAPTYEEVVVGIFVAKNDNVLFVSGKKYAYRFDVDSEFKDLLLTHEETDLFINKMDFSVDQKNRIEGELVIVIQGKNSNNPVRRRFSADLIGERYKMEGKFPYVKLDQPLVLEIKRPSRSMDTIKKIAVTPATVAYDAVVLPIMAITFATFDRSA